MTVSVSARPRKVGVALECDQRGACLGAVLEGLLASKLNRSLGRDPEVDMPVAIAPSPHQVKAVERTRYQGRVVVSAVAQGELVRPRHAVVGFEDVQALIGVIASPQQIQSPAGEGDGGGLPRYSLPGSPCW